MLPNPHNLFELGIELKFNRVFWTNGIELGFKFTRYENHINAEACTIMLTDGLGTRKGL